MSEKSTKLKVEGLPLDITTSELLLVLRNKRRKGGGPIADIELTKVGATYSAIVTFEESDAVDIILERGETVTINEVAARVSRYFDSCERKLKTKLCRNESKSSIAIDDQQVSETENLTDSESSSGKTKNKIHKSVKKTSKKKEQSLDNTDKEQLSFDNLSDSEKSKTKTEKPVKNNTKRKERVVDKACPATNKDSKYLSRKSKADSENTDDEQLSCSDSSDSKYVLEKSKSKTEKPVKKNTKKKEQSGVDTACSASSKDSKSLRRKSKADSRNTDDEQLDSSDDLSQNKLLSEKTKTKTQKTAKKITKKKEHSLSKKTNSVSKSQRSKFKANSQVTDDEEESTEDISESESLPNKSKFKSSEPLKKTRKTKQTIQVNIASSDSNEDSEHEPEQPWLSTIKAKVLDVTKTKDFYIFYFEDSSISQGRFYEESMLLDGLNRNLYVTFYTKQAAVNTTRFLHKTDSNLLKVEIATEEDFKTHANLMSVHGQYCSTVDQRNELMAEVATKTGMDVVDIIQDDEPRSAIIVFNPDTCEDVSTATWTSLFYKNVHLILAPVFKTNCVKVTGLSPLSSDDTLRRYMSNSDRSGGGQVKCCQRLSRAESLITFKDNESSDGVLCKDKHLVEGFELHMNIHYPCLSPQVYKKQIEPIQQQLMLVPETNSRISTQTSSYSHPVVGQQVLPTLRCSVGSLYNSITFDSSKNAGCTVRLCKFGAEFLGRKLYDLQGIMQSTHCKHVLSPRENHGCIYLKLDWPNRISLNEVRDMLKTGKTALCKYLDTFRVAQYSIQAGYIHDFQQFYQMRCKQEMPGVELFVDHVDNVAVFISGYDEFKIKTSVNNIYHNFMSSIQEPYGAGGQSSLTNIGQRRENNIKQGECRMQNTTRDGNTGLKFHSHDGIEKTVQQLSNPDVLPKPDVRPKPNVRPKPKHKKNKNSAYPPTHKDNIVSEEINEDREPNLELLTVEQELEVEDKDIILFQVTNYHKNVEMENKPMKIILNSENKTLIIKGDDKGKIKNAQVALLIKCMGFKSQSVGSLFESGQIQLLNKQDVQNKINDLFSKKGYHAQLNCNMDTITLYFVKDIDEADLKEIIKSHVVVKKKPLDSDVAFMFQSEKGCKFLTDLCESSDGVKVSSYIKLQDKCLQIIASSQQMDLLTNALDHFAEENKTYNKEIPFSNGKQEFVKKFLSQELAQITSSLMTLGAKIIQNAETITVHGLKEGVILGEKTLCNLSERIVVQEFILKYFGIKEYLKTMEGKLHLTNVEQSIACVILQSTGLPSEQGSAKPFQGFQTQPTKLPSLIACAKVGECSFLFMQGDITSLDTEAIVNPLDYTLKCQRGLGKALQLRGGPRIQSELSSSSAQCIPGEVIETTAGNLDKCKHVIHVVCPVFTGTEMDVLEGAITASLRHTENKGLKSVAIPALGTGNVFKFPTVVACKLLMNSLYQHLRTSNSGLTKVYLCDVQPDHVKELMDRFKNIFGQEIENVGDLQAASVNVPTPAPRQFSVKPPKALKNFRHIKVNCVPGEILKQKTDVIVVTIGKTLDLNASKMTKEIDDTLQDELNNNHGNGIEPGDFGITSGGNLQCKNIYYARLHHWKGNQQDHMCNLVYKLLDSADKQSASSISIPAIGTGNLKYPADVAADAITNAICQFAKDKPNSSLNSVNLVVYYRDAEVVKAFQSVLSTDGSRGADSGAEHDAGDHHRSGGAKHYKTSTRGGQNEVQFKSVKLTIKKGDITAEKCDAIVSGIRETMDMSNSGAVCNSLLKKCGSALQDECNTKLEEMTDKGFVVTSAPNLSCQKIYHVSMDKFSRHWDRCISQVLTDAENQGLTSIAMPAFGTGPKRVDYQRIKKVLFSGVEYFAKSSQKILKDVRLVIFSQEMLDEFLGGSDSPKHAPSGHEADDPPQVIAKVSEHVDLKIYADNHPKIVNGIKELNDVFRKAFKTEKEKDKEVKRLSKQQEKELIDEGRRHCLKVSVSIEEGLVTMQGFRSEGFLPVIRMLKTFIVAAVDNHHKSLHRAVVSAKQWQYEKGKWIDFESMTNSELEREYKKKSKHHDITDSNNHTYRIDFVAMKEYNVDASGQKRGEGINVRRFDRTKGGEALPKKWDHMANSENLKLVPLQAGSAEYKAAEQRFINGGAAMPVKKIQRVQNKVLYQQYKVKKREMDLRNPKGHNNEQRLFHGTDAATVIAINETGFDRSHCGKNATAYGKGVYFAVNSSYSVSYAHPSPQGERLMYIVRVLTGVSTPSNASMNFLPNKPSTNIPYDSGSASGMFIIFHDCQAYPEYLITF